MPNFATISLAFWQGLNEQYAYYGLALTSMSAQIAHDQGIWLSLDMS
jgi:hypothetical protein